MYMRQGIQEKEDAHNLEECANATICLDEEDELVGGRISLCLNCFPNVAHPEGVVTFLNLFFAQRCETWPLG